MTCPSHETVVELAFAVANEETLTHETRQAQHHCGECPHCDSILAECTRIITLARQIYAGAGTPTVTQDCLDDNTLAEYLDDVLEPAARSEAERHLASCRRCLFQLIDLGDCMDAAQAWPAAVEYVIELAQRGLRMLAHPTDGFVERSPAPVAVLGESERRICRWTQEADGLRIEITVEHVGPEHATVLVRPLALDAPPEQTRLTVSSDTGVLQSEGLPPEGRFELHDLAVGQYTLELQLPGGLHVPIRLRLTPPAKTIDT